MKVFRNKKEIIGIHIQKFNQDVTPITRDSEALQVLTLKHKKGVSIKPHTHIPKKRTTASLQECLVVRKGKVKIDLYTPNKKWLASVPIKAGEAFLFVSGGHAITMLEDSEIFEIKNGPFMNDKVNL
ncbi:MAG: hypothetical protein HYT28_00165 [Parcubacteria group bacterium]|nr:hypothetical protein [Parcubacteria group bacterium]